MARPQPQTQRAFRRGPVFSVPVFKWGDAALTEEPQKIGAGGNGIVSGGAYGGTKVVFKRSRFEKDDDGDKRRMLSESVKNEINLLASMSHPNVISLFGVIYPTSTTGLTMVLERAQMDLHRALRSRLDSIHYKAASGSKSWSEMLSSPTGRMKPSERASKCEWDLAFVRDDLSARIPPEGAWPLSLVVKVLQDVARGMEYFHLREVAHNDLKSMNILVFEDYRCKVADPCPSRKSTPLKKGRGTFAWCSPEAIRASENKPYAGEFADVWSYGVVMAEIFTRKVPCSNLERKGLDRKQRGDLVKSFIEERAKAVLKGEVESVHDIPDFCPIFLKDLAKSCMNPTPENRPSFGDIVKRLDDFEDVLKLIADGAAEEVEE